MHGAKRQRTGHKRFSWGYRLALSLLILITLALVGVIIWLATTQDLDKLSTKLGILASIVTILIGLPTLFFTIVKWPDSDSPDEPASSLASAGGIHADAITNATNVVSGMQYIATQINYGPAVPSSSGQAPVDEPRSADTSSALWMVPYPRNPLFTGREALLARLAQALQPGQAALVSQPLAINGLGGIGKTQLALEYTYQHRGDYQAVFWVRADTRENLVADFVTIAELLQLQEKDAQNQQIAVAAVKHWLSTYEKWLLILDNADELSMLREFLPLVYGGHLLLTTRAQAMGRLAQRIEVEQLGVEVGALFLLRRAGLLALDAPLEQASLRDIEAARAFTSEVDGLPLALDQAGAYIEETPCSIQDYLRLYSQQQGVLLARRGGLVADHPASVATTWSLSFEQVEQRNRAAADLLRVCAFLHPDAIPEALLREGASHLGPHLEPFETDELAFNEAISMLYAYSLVRRDLSKKALSLHRLVQAVLKNAMNKEAQHLWAERVVRAVNATFPGVEFSTWQSCQAYLPHALACNTLIESQNLTFPEVPSFLNRAAWYLEEHAQYAQAESLYRHSLALCEKLLGLEHSDVAAALNNLAHVFLQQGQYGKAEPLFLRSLAICGKTFGPDHPCTAATLDNLARLYWEQGRLGEAEPLFQLALTIKEQALGPDHPDTSISLNNLAQIYQDQGRYKQAESFLQRSLIIKEQVLGSDHPDIAATLNNLAALYQDQGRYEEAESFLQRSLIIKKQALGPDHPDIAATLNNLAALYQNQGHYEEAEPLYQQALAIYEQALPSAHPSIATILENYSALLRVMNRAQEAQTLEARAKAIRIKNSSQSHS